MAKKEVRRHQGSKKKRQRRKVPSWERINVPEKEKPEPSYIKTHSILVEFLEKGRYNRHIDALGKIKDYYGMEKIEEFLASNRFLHGDSTKAVDALHLESKKWESLVPLPVPIKPQKKRKTRKDKIKLKPLKVTDNGFLKILHKQHMWPSVEEKFGSEQSWKKILSVHLITPGAVFKVTSLTQKVCDQLKIIVDRDKRRLNGMPKFEGEPGELQHIKIPVTVDAIEEFSSTINRGKKKYLIPI